MLPMCLNEIHQILNFLILFSIAWVFTLCICHFYKIKIHFENYFNGIIQISGCVLFNELKASVLTTSPWGRDFTGNGTEVQKGWVAGPRSHCLNGGARIGPGCVALTFLATILWPFPSSSTHLPPFSQAPGRSCNYSRKISFSSCVWSSRGVHH